MADGDAGGAGFDPHLGDALDWLAGLPAGTADACVTDPPYASGGGKAGGRMADTSAKYRVSTRRAGGGGSKARRRQPDFAGDGLDQRVWRKWSREWLSLARRALAPGGYRLAFTDWRQPPAPTDAVQLAGPHWRGGCCPGTRRRPPTPPSRATSAGGASSGCGPPPGGW